MTDLQKTQAEWNQLFKVLGAEVQVFDFLEAAWARAEKLRSGATVEFDENGIYEDFDLAGQAVIGENTDINGKLHVTYTAAGPSTQVYKDSAKAAGDLVASGTSALGVTSLLNEKNGSGFTSLGVTVGTGPFADDSDIEVDVTQDFKRLIEDAYDNVGDVEQDKSETVSKDDLANVASRMESAFSQRKTVFDSGIALGYIASFLGLTATDRKAGAGVTYKYGNGGVDGQVLITDRQGVVAELRQAMLDETLAGAQSVAQTTKTVGNLVAQSTNQGKLYGEGTSALTALGLILADSAISGRVDLRCTTDTPGRTEFTLENVFGEALIRPVGTQREKTGVTGKNKPRASLRYQDGLAGVDFTAQLGPNNPDEPVESGDDGNMFSATTLTGINASDTNFGKVFGTVERTATTAIDGYDEFTFTLYNDSARTNLRATEVVSGIAGTAAFAITMDGNAAFGTTFHKANANVKLPNKGDVDNDLEWDLQIPREGDRWSFDITTLFGSRFNRFAARRYGVAVPTSGSPTIIEGYAAFHPTKEA